jgi:hypothetical protein
VTYDDWKATDPRDSEPEYELDGEDEPPRCECGEPIRSVDDGVCDQCALLSKETT